MWLYSQTQRLLRLGGKNIWDQAGPGDEGGWEAMHGLDGRAHRREPVRGQASGGRGGGRQHAGGLARSEGADLPRVVSVSQGGRV